MPITFLPAVLMSVWLHTVSYSRALPAKIIASPNGVGDATVVAMAASYSQPVTSVLSPSPALVSAPS